MPDEALNRCVGDVFAFAGTYWGLRPLVRSGGAYGDLLSLSAVDELLSERGLRTPFLRIAHDGKLKPASSFTGGGGLGAEVADQVRDDKVLALLGEGATLVLQGLHRIWPALREFCSDLSVSLGCPVQANAYLTPAGNKGFSTHYDTHDVFVIQIAGRKQWRVHEPVMPDPLERQPWGGIADEVAATESGDPVLDRILEPGDLLYLPRGWLHAASAVDAMSLHITLGLRRPTRFTIAEALLALAAEEPLLRKGLPLGTDLTDPGGLGPHLAETVAALTERLEKTDPGRLAEYLRRDLWQGQRPAPVRPIAQLAFAGDLTLDARVRLRPGLRHAYADGRLTLEDREISFPAECDAALTGLLGGAPVRVGDLPGLDGESRLVLVRRLLREAVVVPG